MSALGSSSEKTPGVNLRQRFRKHSIPPSPPSTQKEIKAERAKIEQKSTWNQLRWLLLGLLIILPTVHSLLKDTFRPYRYRTYSQYLRRSEFVSELLPDWLRSSLDLPGLSIIQAGPDIPLYAPFEDISIKDPHHDRQLINRTVAQLRRIEAKFRNISREIDYLASLRTDHTYTAKAALNTLIVAVAADTEGRGTDPKDLKEDIEAVLEAVINMEKLSDRFDTYGKILPFDIQHIISNGTKNQRKIVKVQGRQAILMVWCKAKEYEKTLEELTRKVESLMKAADDMLEGVNSLAKASLQGTCGHAFYIEKPILNEGDPYNCDDAWSIIANAYRPLSLWKLSSFKSVKDFVLGGSGSTAGVMQVDAAKISAGEHSEALREKLQDILDDVKVLHRGIDYWYRVAEAIPGQCSSLL